MKPLSSAIAAALILFSAQGVAEQSRGLLTSHLYRFTPPQAKYIDIQPGHNEHRT